MGRYNLFSILVITFQGRSYLDYNRNMDGQIKIVKSTYIFLNLIFLYRKRIGIFLIFLTIFLKVVQHPEMILKTIFLYGKKFTRL